MFSSRFTTLATLTLFSFLGLTAQAELCSTESKGIFFININRDTNAATNNVLQQCKTSPATDNGECEYNMACGGRARNPYDSGAATCFTTSHSVAFQTTGNAQSAGTMTRKIVEQCQRTQVTDNTECIYNTRCVDFSQEIPYPSGMALCSTRSHSISFRKTGEASRIDDLANSVFEQCKGNQVTDNDECLVNLKCRDAGIRPPSSDRPTVPLPGQRQSPRQDISETTTCRTSSHNINFRRSGNRSEIDQVTAQVLGQCQQNPVTDNDECANNLSCD